MSTSQPYLGVAKAAPVENVRLTLGALGLGFGGFTRAAVAVGDNTATAATPAIAYYQMDASADSDLVAKLNGLCEGALPAGPIWGEGGVISSLDAQNAFMGGNVSVVSMVGVAAEQAQAVINGALAGLGLKPRPDPEP